MKRASLFIGAVMIVTVSGFAAGALAQVPEGFEAVRLTREEETGSSRFGTLIRTVLMVRR